MKIRLTSYHNDILELDAKKVRPELKILEIYFDDTYHPWTALWEPLEINEFNEDFEVVKNKIIEYYKAETKKSTLPNGAIQRKPGVATLVLEHEEWVLRDCRVSDLDINEDKKTIKLAFSFDSVNYNPIEQECCPCLV